MSAHLTIVAEDEFDIGQCDCCGRSSKAVSGWIERGDSVLAAFYVHWTVDAVPDHGANFDLMVGNWGEGSAPADRVAIALEYHHGEDGPFFMVIDATGRLSANLCGRALTRENVVGQLIATEVFAMVDAILLQDSRIAELLRARRVV